MSNEEISRLERDIIKYEELIKCSGSDCERARLNEVLGFYRTQYKNLTGKEYLNKQDLDNVGEWRE